jgi:hypothetical protein
MKPRNRAARSMFTHIAIVAVLCMHSLQAQTTWFEDTFAHSDFGKPWSPTSGEWKIGDTKASIRTNDYDQLLASSYYTYNIQPYSLEVTLRGNRAGVYFSLDDRDSKVLSQMVRFDDNNILCGYFNGAGEYTATSTFTVPKSPIDWTTLRIDVDPKQKRYEVFVDGVSVGTDNNLVFPSGYVGLEASDGTSEFKSFRIFGSSRPKTPSKPRNGTKIRFQHVSVVQTDGKNVRIYNPELRLWQTLNPDGKVISQTSSKEVQKPERQVTFRNRTYEIRNKKVYVENESGATIDSLYERLISPASILLDDRSTPAILEIADDGARAVFQFGLDGKLKSTIDVETMGGFLAPRGMALYSETGVVIADYNKLVFYDPRVDSQPVTATPLSPTEVEIDWHSMTRLHTYVEYSPDGGTTKTVNRVAVRLDGRRTAILRNLEPLSRYSFRVSPTLNTIPEEFTHSKIYRFATLPVNSSKTAITRLSVMYMVYRTICYRDKYPKVAYPQIPDGRTISNEEIGTLKRATEFNRDFYFRNSSCKLVLDFDFSVVEDTLWLHEVGDSDPYWLSPNDRVTKDYEIAAKHFGKTPASYAGLICPYAWVNYPARRTSALRDPSLRDSINIRQAVGGGTYGVPAPWKYSTTTGFTSMPFQDKFSRQDWLITHEFHHQIDALHAASGYAGYNHADIPWQMAGRFGEDFDFNAHIIRNAPVSTWLTLKFGALAQVADVDRDGVPDDDPSLPFDEKRVGGNSHTKDSDGDGLDDLNEVMAGTSHGADLNNKDTDNDGLTDRIDPEPLYPTNPVIAKLNNASELQSTVFAAVHADDLRGTTCLRWDDQFLSFGAITDKPANILIQIDAENDGWFHGFDNFQARVMNNGDSVWVADYYLRDCSSWTVSPKDRRDILKRSDLQISSTVIGGKSARGDSAHAVTIKVPRNDKFGLNLVPGKKMSVRFGLQTKTDLWVWDEPFERNYTMQITLR